MGCGPQGRQKHDSYGLFFTPYVLSPLNDVDLLEGEARRLADNAQERVVRVSFTPYVLSPF